MAIYFSGTAYTLVGTGSVNHGIGTGDFTWCAWVCPNAAYNTTGHMIAHCRDANNFALMAGVISATPWGFYWAGSRSFGTTLTAGRWQHLLVTRRAGVIYGYLDGVESSTTHSDFSGTSMASGTVNVGGTSGGNYIPKSSVAHIGLFACGTGAAQALRIARGAPATDVLGRCMFWLRGEAGRRQLGMIDEGPARVRLTPLFLNTGNAPSWRQDDAKFADVESNTATASSGGGGGASSAGISTMDLLGA